MIDGCATLCVYCYWLRAVWFNPLIGLLDYVGCCFCVVCFCDLGVLVV